MASSWNGCVMVASSTDSVVALALGPAESLPADDFFDFFSPSFVS